MRKHIAGAALAVAATILLSGCTSSGTPSAQGSGSTSPAGSAPTGAASSSAAATAIATSTSASTSTSTSSSAAATSACTGDQLSLSASQDSAAGLFDYIVIEFVNQSSITCTVEGYPGAAGYGVTDSNYAINSTRTLSGHVGDKYTAPVPITLAPGTTASTILEWIDKPTSGHPYADCLRFGAGSFGITAPNVTQTKHIALPSDVCSGLLVHPLVPGSTGRQAS